MWRKATIGGLAALAIVAGGAGVGIAHAAQTSAAPTVATVATADPTATATPSPTATGKPAKAAKGGRVAVWPILGKVKDFPPAVWDTTAQNNTYVTHAAILGQVTAVSSTSVTVKSTDGTSMTFAVTADTKVQQRQAKGSTTTPTIAHVKTGQTVLVGGDKSPDLTAKNIVVRVA